MHSLSYLTLDHDVRQLQPFELAALAAQISGGIVVPSDEDYDEARKVWNGMVDRRPALIARCSTTADVQAAVRFAASRRMLLSVRGGGHHIAGNSVAEGGIVIDLAGLRNVSVDVKKRTARVGGGALLSDLDRETQIHGLATPLGLNSTTGVAGLALGGGFGWLTRLHGMTIDNLIGATVVTADGAVHEVSAAEEPDLFWALRGGGGNFGVVTSFEFRLHPIGPEVYGGLVVYPFRQAEQVLRAWRDFTADAPDELSVWTVTRKAPPLPFLPASVHGKPVVVFPLVWSGNLEEGERACAPVLQFGDPLASTLGPISYAGFQKAFDAQKPPGRRNYWKSNHFTTLSDEAIDQMIASAVQQPGDECEIFVAQLGGAMARVSPTATPYAGRDTRYVMNVHARWADAGDDERMRAWARRAFEDAAPHAVAGGYVNFLTDDEAGRVATSYGENYLRLQAIKHRYDPDNLFRMNLNITPAMPEDLS